MKLLVHFIPAFGYDNRTFTLHNIDAKSAIETIVNDYYPMHGCGTYRLVHVDPGMLYGTSLASLWLNF